MAIKVYHLSITDKQHEALVFFQYVGWKMTQVLGENPRFVCTPDEKERLISEWWKYARDLHPLFEQLFVKGNKNLDFHRSIP